MALFVDRRVDVVGQPAEQFLQCVDLAVPVAVAIEVVVQQAMESQEK